MAKESSKQPRSTASALRQIVRSATTDLRSVATASTRRAAAPARRLSALLCALLNCEPWRGKARAWWVVDPRVNFAIGYWDLVTTTALVFTAVSRGSERARAA